MGSSISIVTKYDLSQFEEGVLTENIKAVIKKINSQLPSNYKLELVVENLIVTEISSTDENLFAFQITSRNMKINDFLTRLDNYIYVYK